jgi:hypothetical protein
MRDWLLIPKAAGRSWNELLVPGLSRSTGGRPFWLSEAIAAAAESYPRITVITASLGSPVRDAS